MSTIATAPPVTDRAEERRVVTVLFADVVGFTAMAERMDPEQVRGLINACFDQLVPIIEEYGGTIDKFMGDEVMALFGAPVAHEDDPIRALRAALVLMATLPQMNARYGTDLGLHIGVNTGLVVAGGIGSQGRQQYTVLGDAVNLAARLKTHAEPGEILVGPETYRHTAPAFEFAALDPLHVKGKTEAVPVYRLLGLKARPGRLRGLAGLESPMVGREEEMAALVQAGRSLQAGRGGIVLVIGEAGLGKTRLVSEWRAAAGQPTWQWAEGRCLSYGRGLAYHLLVDLLRSLLGLSAASGEEEARATLLAYARDLLADAAEEVYPYLGHLLGLRPEGPAWEQVQALDPQTLQARYQIALRRLLLALAGRGPLVLVLEDIHWADPSSAELLARLLPLSARAPLLFCMLTRPDTDVPGWRLVTASREQEDAAVAELVLSALSESASRQLLSNLLAVEALPEALRARILQKAEGNPFFVEEVIRMLIDQGVLVHDGARWSAQREVDTLDIPGSLQGLLLARIDRLPEEARHVLRVAAVIGRQFAFPVLADVLAAAAPGRVPVVLNRLEKADLVYLSHTQPELEYAFRHTLVREAAYASLLKQECRRLHRAVGESMERLYAGRLEGLAPTLAQHFAEAEDWPRALRYLVQAGDLAYERYAMPEAIAHYTRALEIAGRDGAAEVPWQHLYLRRGRALELDARYEEALANYAAMEEQARSRGDVGMELAAIVEHARVHSTPNPTHDPARGQALAERALALARQAGDRAAEARVHWILMLLNWLAGSPRQSLQHGEQSLALARQLDLREQLAYTLHDIHRAYANTGQVQRAVAALEEARVLWRELHNLPMLADNLNSSADLAMQYGDYEKSLHLAEESFGLSQSIGNLWNQAFARGMAGEVYVLRGEMDQAFAALQEALTLGEQAGLVILNLRVRMDLAEAYILIGAPAQARPIVERICAQAGDSFFHASFHLIALARLAQIEAHDRNLDGAAAAAGNFQQLAEQCEPASPWFSPVMRACLADAALRRGDAAQALEILGNPPPRENRQLGRGSLLDGLIVRGQALLALGDIERAAPALDEALLIAKTLNSRHRLWRALLLLSELEAQRDPLAAAELRRQAREVVAYIAAHIASPELRATFLNMPECRALGGS